jgi:glycosyltransferase involved in cell wall biosynthesis
VVLEAFAAGIPVLGSDLGGIAELVEHEVDGLLVEPASPEAWGGALRRVLDDPDLLTRLRRGVRPPRRMGQVAEEMLAVYHRLTRLAGPVPGRPGAPPRRGRPG